MCSGHVTYDNKTKELSLLHILDHDIYPSMHVYTNRVIVVNNMAILTADCNLNGIY